MRSTISPTGNCASAKDSDQADCSAPMPAAVDAELLADLEVADREGGAVDVVQRDGEGAEPDSDPLHALQLGRDLRHHIPPRDFVRYSLFAPGSAYVSTHVRTFPARSARGKHAGAGEGGGSPES
ncbi:MAG: hypothetical protein WDN49_21660 [Acetobacteraceae bacterium]